ncbi:hypothetical protein BH11MYX4_BH11MYX4_06170 [soil metagenome]
MPLAMAGAVFVPLRSAMQAIVGSAVDGARLEQLLTAQLREVAGLEPSVVAMAVAGAANIQRLESSFARAERIAPARRPSIDVADSTRPTTADRRAPAEWIPALREALEAGRDHPLFACVAVPTSFGADAAAAAPASAEVASLLGAARTDHLAVVAAARARQAGCLVSTRRS